MPKGAEFPKMLYKGTWEQYDTRIVKDAEEEKAMVEKGWFESLGREIEPKKEVKAIEDMTRDELDEYLIEYGLVDSYRRFVEPKMPYPFVEKRELKPRARIPDVEYECHNRFLVLFVEDVVASSHKKYLRFFDDNKTTKAELKHNNNSADSVILPVRNK